MKLDDVPDLKGNQYPNRISVSLTAEAKKKLDDIKRIKRKDTAELVRMLIDDFLRSVDLEGAS